jgi:hypothetical protein
MMDASAILQQITVWSVVEAERHFHSSSQCRSLQHAAGVDKNKQFDKNKHEEKMPQDMQDMTLANGANHM